MQHLTFTQTTLCGAVLIMCMAAQGKELEREDVIEPIDTVTIIGRKGDVADVPGSAHVMDQDDLEVFIETDILRVLRSVPGVYVQEEEASVCGRISVFAVPASIAVPGSRCWKTAS